MSATSHKSIYTPNDDIYFSKCKAGVHLEKENWHNMTNLEPKPPNLCLFWALFPSSLQKTPNLFNFGLIPDPKYFYFSSKLG